MLQVILRCKDPRVPAGDWTLLLDGTGGRLSDSSGETWALFPINAAESQFMFPSFWQSIKDLSVRSDRAGWIVFVPERDVVIRLQTYVQFGMAAQGSDALHAMRQRGWWLVAAGGAACAAFATLCGVAALQIYRTSLPPKVPLGAGLLLLGAPALSRGVTLLRRARRAALEVGR